MPMGGNSSGAVAGDVKFWPVPTPPDGWLKANGAALSRSVYAALFARIGTNFGAGDGVTTFVLPDFRGVFIRAYDDGRGVDPARAFGSNQAEATRAHVHGSGAGIYGYPTGSPAGGYGLDPLAAASFWDTDSSVGDETRPINICMLACIKY